MRSLIIFSFAALVACSYAKVHYRPRPPGYVVGHPDAANRRNVVRRTTTQHSGRHARDSTLEHNARRKKVFVTLGSTDHLVYGRGGYKQDIFNDYRSRLQGEGHKKRVLGAGGDISVLANKFKWYNANAMTADLDVDKEISDGYRMKATTTGVLKFDNKTRFVAGGKLDKQFGRRRVGIQGPVENDF